MSAHAAEMELTIEGLKGGADHGNHGRLAVAAEAVLQDAGELGVPVGNMAAAAALRERSNNIAQSTEGLIDLLALLQPLACSRRHMSLVHH